MERRQQAVPRGPHSSVHVFIASAEGASMCDVDGNMLLDFAGGIGCINVGHCAAFELVRDRHTREAAKEETETIIKDCWQNGLLLLPAGTYGNVIRRLVPLVITDEQLDEGFLILEAALAKVCSFTGSRERENLIRRSECKQKSPG
jgi:4-aminobutyrate aminotransferase-like enzyme